MEFRLNYEGPLLSTQKEIPLDGRKDARADHKHGCGRNFHPQLRPLLAGKSIRSCAISGLILKDLPWMLKQHVDAGGRMVGRSRVVAVGDCG